jgi:hypothetical protein
VTVNNDETDVFITFDVSSSSFKIQKAELVIGDLAHITAATDLTAWPKLPAGPNPPDFSQTLKPEVTSYTFTIPAANYDDCFLISAFAKLVQRDPTTNKVVAVDHVFLQSQTKTSCKCWSTYVQYCKQSCPQQCGQLTTYTQGGYGNDDGNGAPTKYLIANFANAFPDGVTIGCSTGFTLKMTSAAAIQAYLPSTTIASVLDQNWVDNGPDNVLAGQLLTLALNIGFDNYDANFGAAQIHLQDMVIASGDFQGMTVKQFFDIANDVLGGCSTDYTPAQINVAATNINENYDNGTVDNGFLQCPTY